MNEWITTLLPLGPLAGVLVAQTVAVGLWYNNQRAQLREGKRARQLDRLNEQISNFYGPLSALYEIGEKQWLTFVDKYSNDPMPEAEFKRFFAEHGNPNPPDRQQLEEFRLWMQTTFMPNNIRMEEVVVNRADLVVGAQMPPCLFDLCGHVAAYKPIMERWALGEFDPDNCEDHRAAYGHPGFALREYVRASIGVLKRAQERLLNREIPDLKEGELAEEDRGQHPGAETNARGKACKNCSQP